MAVTKQTYTAAPTWTAAQFADLVGDAFVDAGLMTDWYDSFLSGSVENRILEVVYDATKAYGKTYLWFMFSGTSIAVAAAAGWNNVGNVPAGTPLIDFRDAITNTVSDKHWTVLTGSSSVAMRVIRYTSQLNTDSSWFVLRSGISSFVFTVDNSVSTLPFIDLDKSCHTPFVGANKEGDNNNGRSIGFTTPIFSYRRSFLQSMTDYGYANPNRGLARKAYAIMGRRHATSSTNTYSIILPTATTAGNPAYTEDKLPIFTNLRISDYTDNALPGDFGVMPHRPNNIMVPEDKMIIDAGIEEWEVLVNSPGNNSNTYSALFVARVV